VALLTLGAYVTSVLTAGTAVPELAYLALAIAACSGRSSVSSSRLLALRLRTFYFAMTTLGFATIVTQVALPEECDRRRCGVPGPVFPWPFDTPGGSTISPRPGRGLHG
jgi:branched-chain amino acid transport system permease protein